tara:strand:- start:7783 stop:8817 length:1035 start_codon:yes stop_codon:yes gene_type:complete
MNAWQVNIFRRFKKMSFNISQFVPAEWMPHRALWCGWPSDPALWPNQLYNSARSEIADMVRFIAQGEKVKLLVSGAEAFTSAQEMLGSNDNIDIISHPFGDIWLRDTGPVWTARAALRFRHNGWGGKYIYNGDDVIGDFMAHHAETPVLKYDFVLEGGAVDHNGAGVVLTTEQCMLNQNRNPHWNRDIAERELCAAFNARRICWLKDGLLNDHTDGHVDNLARFVGKNTVLCQQGVGDDDPNTALYATTAALLREYGFDVITVPSPGLVHDPLTGEAAPASHMNFIIGNGYIAVPTYGSASANKAVRKIGNIFPNHVVKGFSSVSILTGGGSFHCITQQEPIAQ